MCNILAKCRLVWGLLFVLVATPTGLLAQSERTAMLKATDPNGFILTLTAVTVVFSALILLIIFFKTLGYFIQTIAQKSRNSIVEVSQSVDEPIKSTLGNEVAVAIGLALKQSKTELNDEAIVAVALSLEDYISGSHDYESYKLSIQHRPTQWHSKHLGLRKFPY